MDIQFKAPERVPDNGPDIIVLRFADSKIPVFRETRNKDYIKYGEDNLYPEYLNFLFNKSAKHNAIINGKANYIFGNGYENGDFIINRTGESLNDITKKSLLDIQIYGGFKLEVIWSFAKKIVEVYHVDYSCIRKGKDGGFYYKESWQASNREDEKYIPGFDPHNPIGSQIFEYNEYRPGVRFYPLPGYIGSNNYIETDIEISKYYLSAIRNGMMPSKLVQFYEGNSITDDKKKDIERRWKNKFSGAENAGKFVMVFNTTKDKQVTVDDLSASDLDKHFQELNKTTQQEIYAGHGITNSALFGIMEQGKLGGNSGEDMKVSYSIFQNTYSKPKAKDFDRELNWILGYSNFKGVYELIPSDPIGINFDIKDIVSILPKQFIYEKIGVPQEQWNTETVGGALPVAPQVQGAVVNDNIKNLTGKQKQNIDRIVRQYENEKHPMNWSQASMMLKKGYGLDDEDVIAFLGPEPASLQMSFSSDDETIEIFDQYGDSKNDYEIIKSKKVCFSQVEEIEDDEIIYTNEAFLKYDVTATENKIIELIKKDANITVDVIANTIGETKAFVESRIALLMKKGYIESTIEKIGEDEIIKRIIPKGIDITIPPIKSKINPTQIYIKYSYEGPEDSRNRPFCAKLLSLHRLYSRQDIERISQRLGYSVFDRRGGFWRQKDGTTLPHCRHNWASNILIKKGGNNVN